MTTVSASMFPPPRIPVSPVLSFRAPFSSPRGAVVPSVADAGSSVWVTNGRIALVLALQLSGVRSGDSVLLPAYNCRAMVEAVRWVGARPVLYKSNEDLTPDLADISEKSDARTRALVAVHFFGFPQNLTRLRAVCDDRRIALIEDCAHAFFGRVDGKPLGSVGDFAIASAMKFFPIWDGGLLVSARRSLTDVRLRSGGMTFQLRALVNNLERSFGYSRLKPFNWLMAAPLYVKDKVWSYTKSRKRPPPGGPVEPQPTDDYCAIDSAAVDLRMAAASSALRRWTSVPRLIARRRQHYSTLVRAFARHPACRPLFADIGSDVVPYVFPLVVGNPAKAFPQLKMRGVPLFRWEDVDRSVCDTSAYYSEHLFQLPCHQELSTAELEWLIAEVELAAEL